jgi:S-DNA-T family DNA segregation ATPase FtsK/SpoIIIE
MGISNLLQEFEMEYRIKSKWKTLMRTINNIRPDDKNKVVKEFKTFELQEIYLKEYGFNTVVSVPFGNSLLDFRKLIPAIGVIYQANVIAELTSTKSAIFMRVHFYGLKLNDIDNIKFKWYMNFTDKDSRNIDGETYRLESKTNIYHPTLKEKDTNKKMLIGYKFKINIPNGLSYDDLEKKLVDLNKLFGICSMKFDDDTNTTNIEIIKKKLGDNELYKPIKVKPWELYIGMTHAYKPVILDFSYSPNALIGGASGSGKTVGMMMALLNLVIHNNENEVNLYITMLSDKQDLKVFRDIKHCKSYARDLDSVLKQLKDLNTEIKRRNNLFDKSNKNGEIVNIYDYNKVFKNKLPLIYFCLDEVASFAVNGTEVNSNEEGIKKKCNAFLWKINREGRSAGVYCILCTQRGSLSNMTGDVKANLSNQICFYFPNTASSLTILGDGDLATLSVKQKKQREFIATGNENYFGKTLFLTTKMMVEYLKPLKVTKIEQKSEEITEKTIDNRENIQKNDKNIRWDNKRKRRDIK